MVKLDTEKYCICTELRTKVVTDLQQWLVVSDWVGFFCTGFWFFFVFFFPIAGGTIFLFLEATNLELSGGGGRVTAMLG